MRASASSGEKINFKSLAKPVAVGLIFGAACIFALLIVFSAVMAFKDIPQSLIPAIAIVSVAIGGFVAGFVASRMVRERGMLIGFICGMVISIVIFLAGLAVLEGSLGGLAVTKFVVCITSSVIGGVCGVNTKHRR